MNKFQKRVNKEVPKLWRKKFDQLLVEYPIMVGNLDKEFTLEEEQQQNEFIERVHVELRRYKLKKEIRATLKKERF